jgi:IS30 family transposase
MSPSRPARRPWTADERKKLDDLTKAGKIAAEIATALQRTPHSIYSQLQRLDIKRKKAARRLVELRLKGEEMTTKRPLTSPPWTPEQDAQLRALAASGESPAAIAQRLSRSVSAIDNRARKLRIALAPLRKKSGLLRRLAEMGLRMKGK